MRLADIEYRDNHDFTKDELERLFLSVNWSSGHFPDKLVTAMKNYETVFSAWDGGRLVGLICAMDDGIMNAYVHYLLVDPEHQGQAIGRTLVKKVKEQYKDYMRIVVVAYEDELSFYITNVVPYFDLTLSGGISIEIFSVGDVFSVNIMQRNGDRQYVDCFTALLEEAGVAYVAEEPEHFQLSGFQLPE